MRNILASLPARWEDSGPGCDDAGGRRSTGPDQTGEIILITESAVPKAGHELGGAV
jgi:hypothetical protein